LSAWARERRWRNLATLHPKLNEMTVVDLGGDIASWLRAPTRPLQLVSVIEHLGGHWRRMAFAQSVRRLGDRHWIQTPNRYFPLEAHWLFPGFQFLPSAAKARVSRLWPVGAFGEAPPGYDHLRPALDHELLTASELRWYFPDLEIRRERLFGLTKSLIAVR
jgi:hypothetical protein